MLTRIAVSLALSSAPMALAQDHMVIDVSDEQRPEVEAMLAALAAARDGGPLGIEDLTRIVRVAPSDQGVLAAAYPAPLTVTCAGDVCRAAGTGEAARVRTVADTPDLAGVSLGVRASLVSRFRTSEDGSAVIVCDVDGVYFQKLIVRKNLRAFRADRDTVEVWLSGAANAPSCEEAP